MVKIEYISYYLMVKNKTVLQKIPKITSFSFRKFFVFFSGFYLFHKQKSRYLCGFLFLLEERVKTKAKQQRQYANVINKLKLS